MHRAHLDAGPLLALGSPTAEITAGELAEALEPLALYVHFAAARPVLLVIRRDGYLGTEATLAAMEADADLRASPGTAAHLIHGSSEGRFEITHSPGPQLRRADVERIGFGYLAPADALGRFCLDGAPESGACTDIDGEPFTLIRRPGLGLWCRAS